jgi:BirA family biotin operon repressor/biotin-[acetyl-CoA-carboxylase] ligase
MTQRGLALHWPAEAIWEAVAPALPGFTVEVLPSIDSTNTELMRRARAGQIEPVLLVAEAQSAGRGRLGRQWQGATADDVGATLTFSLGLPLQMVDWSGLSLAVGLSVVQSLHPALQLKWPNDVWLQGRKLAGILIETASVGAVRYAVIGIGINIAPRAAAGLSIPPAWLQELEPGLDAPTALRRVVPPLVQMLQRFTQHGFAPLRPAYATRDAPVVPCNSATAPRVWPRAWTTTAPCWCILRPDWLASTVPRSASAPPTEHHNACCVFSSSS